MNYKEIKTAIINKDLEPIYFLMGNEPYYIDKLCDKFSKDLLTPEEQEFNQIILYGKEITPEQIISESKQFPFGSEKRLVIVKEAQAVKNIEKLDTYLDSLPAISKVKIRSSLLIVIGFDLLSLF